MIRRLFIAASALCVLFCVATLVAWSRSIHTAEGFSRVTRDGSFFIMWREGTIYACRGFVVFPHAYDQIAHPLYHFHEPVPSPDVYGAPWSRVYSWGTTRLTSRWFRYGSGPSGGGFERWVAVPCWELATISALPPLLAAARAFARRKRSRAGFCPRCEYDLRASTDRCPECGTPIIEKAGRRTG